MPDVHISDIKRIKEQVWDFDPQWEFEYTQRELRLMAEKILLLDPKPSTEHPVWLNVRQLQDRQKREIYNGAGIADPHIASGLYWRTHPQGRRVQSEETRAKGGSFYR